MPTHHNVMSLLRAPGQGLLTVTTGTGEAQKILNPLFGRKNLENWLPVSRDRRLERGPHILGFPSDAGGGICRGAAHGPLHLRAALYSREPHWAAHDLGDLPCIPQLLEESMLNFNQRKKSGKVLWGARFRPSSPVSPLNLLKEALIQGFRENPDDFSPLVVGGDHSTSWAVTEALFASRKMKNLGILHFDAHTDLMEHRYGVEHCFATWAAHCMKRFAGKQKKNFVQVGLRISGKTKAHWERKFGLQQFWMKELQKQDPKIFAEQLIRGWKNRGVKHLYISFDVDALDPTLVPSTGTPEPKGLSVAWSKKVIEVVSKSFPVIAADIVELAPVLGGKSESRKSSKNSALIAESLLKALKRGLH